VLKDVFESCGMLGAVVIEIVFNLLHIKMILLYHTQEIIELYLT